MDDLRSGIAGLIATGSIERPLANRFDRDAQKALRYWERGDDERAGENCAASSMCSTRPKTMDWARMQSAS